MSFLRSKRGVLTYVVVALAFLFLVRPGANRLKSRVVSSISLALGRPVDVASVRIRFLPRPGFDLENFVVHDDPAFGAEPMLRAAEVTASLRLTSLLRGRLEISRLSFVEPSLNLVRVQGRWNLATLVERAERISVAPTAKVNSDRRKGFPYIEGSQGRINFKLGQEKKPYALTEADFSLWQESENEWRIRLRTRLVSSDFNVMDTGQLQLRGMWRRAASLHETPVQFTVDWNRAQLGQLTKLAYGMDEGWRGAISLAVSLTGTATNLAVTAQASADDFHRYDVIPPESLHLQTQCIGQYRSTEDSLSDIACHAPVSNGTFDINGRVLNLFTSRSYNLIFLAHNIPAQSLLLVARHTNSAIPQDLILSGVLDGQLSGNLTPDSATPDWEGSGQAVGLQLIPGNGESEFALGTVPFLLSAKHAKLLSNSLGKPDTPHYLEVGLFHVALGRAVPLTVQGRVWQRGYDFAVQGEAQLKKLLTAARLVGIPALHVNADGGAKVALQVSGQWSGVEPPAIVGKAQLHAVQAQVAGLNAPIEISAANLNFKQDQVAVEKIIASAAGTSWRGSMTSVRPCITVSRCELHFDLHADKIAIARLNQLLNPQAAQDPWYRTISSSSTSGHPFLLKVNASGKLTADRLVVGKLEANNITADVLLNEGKLRLGNLKADLLGGRHTGEWRADFTMKPPQYNGDGTLQQIDLAQLAQSMNSDWIIGTATATYRASTVGLAPPDLFSSATANLEIDAVSADLPHFVLASAAAPLQIRHLTAHLLLHDGELDVRAGQLETPNDTFHLSGTASLNQVLSLKLLRDDLSGFSISGTLTEPHVSQLASSETRAALKP
jgi:AsmA family